MMKHSVRRYPQNRFVHSHRLHMVNDKCFMIPTISAIITIGYLIIVIWTFPCFIGIITAEGTEDSAFFCYCNTWCTLPTAKIYTVMRIIVLIFKDNRSIKCTINIGCQIIFGKINLFHIYSSFPDSSLDEFIKAVGVTPTIFKKLLLKDAVLL